MFMIIRSAFMFETLEHLNFGFVSTNFIKSGGFRFSDFCYRLSFNFTHT
jgi:hypothetical protein